MNRSNTPSASHRHVTFASRRTHAQSAFWAFGDRYPTVLRGPHHHGYGQGPRRRSTTPLAMHDCQHAAHHDPPHQRPHAPGPADGIRRHGESPSALASARGYPADALHRGSGRAAKGLGGASELWRPDRPFSRPPFDPHLRRRLDGRLLPLARSSRLINSARSVPFGGLGASAVPGTAHTRDRSMIEAAVSSALNSCPSALPPDRAVESASGSSPPDAPAAPGRASERGEEDGCCPRCCRAVGGIDRAHCQG